MSDNTLFKSFDKLEDPRSESHKRYNLLEVIVLAVCATVAGADDWVSIEMFCKCHMKWFKTFLTLENGIPSHDTFGRIFSMIDPKRFKECFIEWTQEISTVINGELVAIDGKTLCASFNKAANKSATHIVSAWAQQNRLVLGQVKCHAKSNEITAIPELLDLIALKNCIVTIDAIGCQKNIASKIIDKKGDYVLALKKNNRRLQMDAVRFFKEHKTAANDIYVTQEKNHGRHEKRTYHITGDLKQFYGKHEWKGIQSIGMVEVERTVNNKTTTSKRYYISSLTANVQQFASAVRGHWSVENNLHWTLDVVFNEDRNTVRKDHGPENMTMLRHIALNLLKQETSVKKSLKGKRHLAGWDINYLEKVIFGC